MRRTVVTVLAAASALAMALGLLPAGPAGAAGMTTHTWMADSAVDRVRTPALRELLRANLDYVKAGAKFPDGGYIPGNVHGEEAHWQRFADIYAGIIRDKPGCGELSRPDGPCAAQIAHLFGIVAHGTGDEVWDWLFEPNSPDRNEYYTDPNLPTANEGGQETQMDLVAIGVYGRGADTVPPLTFKSDLIAAFAAAGVPGVTEQQLDTGQAVFSLLHQVESTWATDHLDGVLANMPWMSAHLVDAPGGVDWAARSIAAQWEALWAQVLGPAVPTEVSNTYPAAQERGVPATGWTRRPEPGSHRGRGGARTRIAASLTYAVPYRSPGGPPVSNELVAGAMTLTERDSGVAVPVMAGFPRAVPYGADSGEHTIAIQPAGDLAPCTWYRVAVTPTLRDASGTPVVAHSWTFRTGQDAAGTACSDDPTGDRSVDAYVERAYRDLLGREASASEVAYWAGQLVDDAVTPGRFALVLVTSQRGRQKAVADLYLRHLGRAATAGDLAYWAAQLSSFGYEDVQARLVGSAEFYARAGGAPEGWLRAAYPSVLGRSADAASVTFWSAYLNRGADRLALARVLVSGGEARRVRVHGAYVALNAEPPSAAELEWGAAWLGRDVRQYLVRVASQAPYLPGSLSA